MKGRATQTIVTVEWCKWPSPVEVPPVVVRFPMPVRYDDASDLVAFDSWKAIERQAIRHAPPEVMQPGYCYAMRASVVRFRCDPDALAVELRYGAPRYDTGRRLWPPRDGA